MDVDGHADLVFRSGLGGEPGCFILSGVLVSVGDVAGAQANPLANFFVAGDLSNRGGARVAVTNTDGNAKADVAVGSGAGARPECECTSARTSPAAWTKPTQADRPTAERGD